MLRFALSLSVLALSLADAHAMAELVVPRDVRVVGFSSNGSEFLYEVISLPFDEQMVSVEARVMNTDENRYQLDPRKAEAAVFASGSQDAAIASARSQVYSAQGSAHPPWPRWLRMYGLTNPQPGQEASSEKPWVSVLGGPTTASLALTGPANGSKIELSASTARSQYCAGHGRQASGQGAGLKLKFVDPNGVSRTIHEDGEELLGRERGCPYSYKIVQTRYHEYRNSKRLAVVVETSEYREDRAIDVDYDVFFLKLQ
jgi:hypothetical protein